MYLGMLYDKHDQPLDSEQAHNDSNTYKWSLISEYNMVIVLLTAGMYSTAPAATTATTDMLLTVLLT